ncbi:hypothetical protein C2S53_002415 [Perilla frutescens var. hirtella]|uniref:Uncharacterized protein n=1 Tax=Perilla frutescens var. hirtella TaxID=608512 RepID=A0AAD4JH51_PERFH|nr:hypothetical protein C2S53_002415 [Perilla frutescens var. hirtella]
MGGKGIRRREKNYRAAHGGSNSSRLPPPPDPSSLDALPSKLRKIMSLAGAAKQSFNFGKKNAGDGADKIARLGEGTESITTGTKRKRDGQNLMAQNKQQGDDAPEKKKKKKRNSKKADDLRFEALDKATAGGSRRKDRKKKQLEARKEKHKNAQIEEDMDFPGREHIQFGDIVEAPPKLTVPKAFKAVQDASQERLRLQAVEAYRKRKAWDSRPGVKLPPPVTTAPL